MLQHKNKDLTSVAPSIKVKNNYFIGETKIVLNLKNGYIRSQRSINPDNLFPILLLYTAKWHKISTQELINACFCVFYTNQTLWNLR